MLQRDPSAASGHWREGELDLGDELRLVGPLGVELPGKQCATRRLPGEHLAPLPLVARRVALEPATTRPRLDHDVDKRMAPHALVLRPPSTHRTRKELESAGGVRLDLHAVKDRRNTHLRLPTSISCC